MRAAEHCPVSILQARGVGACPEVALSTIERFVAVTNLLAVELPECFHEWRMEQRLGGCFSKKWGGMPAESDVSAPDSNLLEAGVTLADVGGAGGAACA